MRRAAPAVAVAVAVATVAAAVAMLTAATAVVAQPASRPSAGGLLDVRERIRLSRGLVKVEVVRRQGGYSMGTGVIVGEGRVLTNCHVTRDAVSVSVIRHGLRQPVRAQAADAAHDLCLLDADAVPAADALPLGRSTALASGRPVYAIGFTGGVELSTTSGTVAGLHRLDGGNVAQVTTFFNSGASGGALLDDELRLVGILTFRMRGGEAHYFASPVEWLALGGGLDRPENFRDVAPLGPEAPVPYWARPEAQQPGFLRAEALLRTARYDELAALAASMADTAPDDPQLAALQGDAEEALGHLDAARAAFERAVGLDRSFAVGWFKLGRLALRQGRADAAKRALAVLDELAPTLASRLGALVAGP